MTVDYDGRPSGHASTPQAFAEYCEQQARLLLEALANTFGSAPEYKHEVASGVDLILQRLKSLQDRQLCIVRGCRCYRLPGGRLCLLCRERWQDGGFRDGPGFLSTGVPEGSQPPEGLTWCPVLDKAESMAELPEALARQMGRVYAWQFGPDQLAAHPEIRILPKTEWARAKEWWRSFHLGFRAER